MPNTKKARKMRAFKFGFLDGKAGFSYCLFQALFYRSLVDQLILEKSNKYLGDKNA